MACTVLPTNWQLFLPSGVFAALLKRTWSIHTPKAQSKARAILVDMLQTYHPVVLSSQFSVGSIHGKRK